MSTIPRASIDAVPPSLVEAADKGGVRFDRSGVLRRGRLDYGNLPQSTLVATSVLAFQTGDTVASISFDDLKQAIAQGGNIGVPADYDFSLDSEADPSDDWSF